MKYLYQIKSHQNHQAIQIKRHYTNKTKISKRTVHIQVPETFNNKDDMRYVNMPLFCHFAFYNSSVSYTSYVGFTKLGLNDVWASGRSREEQGGCRRLGYACNKDGLGDFSAGLICKGNYCFCKDPKDRVTYPDGGKKL